METLLKPKFKPMYSVKILVRLISTIETIEYDVDDAYWGPDYSYYILLVNSYKKVMIPTNAIITIEKIDIAAKEKEETNET